MYVNSSMCLFFKSTYRWVSFLLRSADIQEKELLKLAQDVSPSKYTELCIELGESYSQSQGTLDRRHLNVADSLMEIFCKWKNKQRDGTDYRKDLAKVLCDVDLNPQGDKMSRGKVILYLK